jgi:DNA-binding response OmpR family regulator
MEVSEKSRVLLAEDDPELNRLIVTWLKRANLEVDSVFDGGSAIEAIKTKRYSAILLDVMMPRVNGIDVIEYINEHQPKLMSKVIVMTAGGEEVLDRVKGHAIYKLVTKPFDLRDLLDSALECARIRAGAQLSFSRSESDDPDKTKKVLIVDDDEASRAMMSRGFSSSFSIDMAADGSEAIEKLKMTDYDVVLLDLRMPGVDGLAVIGYLREHQKHVLDNVVLVTITPNDVADVRDLVGGVINKPFQPEEIANFVRAHVLRMGSEAETGS